MERSPVSEARQVGEPHLTLVDVHTAEFSATMQLRKHLTGIEQAARIEGTFEPLLLRQVGFVKHRVHQVALLDAYPMLAGQNAAYLDAEAKDVGAEGTVNLMGCGRTVHAIRPGTLTAMPWPPRR